MLNVFLSQQPMVNQDPDSVRRFYFLKRHLEPILERYVVAAVTLTALLNQPLTGVC